MIGSRAVGVGRARGSISVKGGMTMRRSCSWLGAGCALLLALSSGCGDPFAPPSRPRPVETNDSIASAKSIYYVVPRVPTAELELWGLLAQNEANGKQVIFRVAGPGSAESPALQPESVRKSVADGASALIVVPGDSPELGPALAEAEAKKVPVVLIGRSVPAPPGTKPFTYVDHEPFEVSAGRIVSTILQDLKKAGKPADGTALVLADKEVDDWSSRRVAALEAAAKAAGLRRVEVVSFDGSKRDTAKLAVVEAVKAHPDVAVVLADETNGMRAASEARLEFKGKPAFLVGGYGGYRISAVPLTFPGESCFVEGHFEELARLAVVTALARLRGEPVDERVVQVPTFNRGSGLVADETSGTNPKPRPFGPPPGPAKEDSKPSADPKPQ
jgi:ABC-type sugar transport system substrate-binding protein